MLDDNSHPEKGEAYPIAHTPEAPVEHDKEGIISELVTLLRRERPTADSDAVAAADYIYKAACADLANDEDSTELYVEELVGMGFDWFEAQGYIVAAYGLIFGTNGASIDGRL